MGHFKNMDIELQDREIFLSELENPDCELSVLCFGSDTGEAQSLEEMEFSTDEMEALELHAERWDLERGGYL